ncbi:MAG: ATP-binding protein [Candidatus Hydrogenedentota bacterium]
MSYENVCLSWPVDCLLGRHAVFLPSLDEWTGDSKQCACLGADLDKALEPAAILAQATGVVYANRAFETLGGTIEYPLKTVPDSPDPWDTIARGEVWHGALRFDAADRGAFAVRVAAVPLQPDGGPITHCCVIVYGGAGAAQHEEQLLSAQQKEIVQALFGGFAHAFANSMAPLMGYVELLSEDLADGPPESRNYLQKLVESSDHMSSLMRMMHTLTQEPASKPAALGIGRLAAETVEMLQPLLPRKIRLFHEMAEGPDTVFAAPGAIRRIVLTLCVNAWQAMRDTGGVITLQVEPLECSGSDALDRHGLPDGSYVRLNVCDTGPALPPDPAQLAFTPLTPVRRPGDRTGLGLFAVQRFAESLGGIAAASHGDDGFTVNVLLPLATNTQVQTVSPEALQQCRGHECILLADPDEEARIMLARGFLALGYHVTTRPDGPSALDAIRDKPNRFNLLIACFAMDGLSGLELGEAVSAVRADIPMILYGTEPEEAWEAVTNQPGRRIILSGPAALEQVAIAARKALE